MFLLLSSFLFACSEKESSPNPDPEKSFSIQSNLPKVENAHAYKASEEVFDFLIDVTPTAIYLNGEQLLALENGQIPESERDNALIKKLYTKAEERYDNFWQLKNTATPDKTIELQPPLLAIDKDVSPLVVKDILFSLGMAKYPEFYLLVSDSEPTPHTASTGHWLKIEKLEKDQLKLTKQFLEDDAYKEKEELVTNSALSKTFQLLGGGCAMMDWGNHSSYAEELNFADQLYGAGASKLSLAVSNEPSQSKTPLSSFTPSGQKFQTGDTLSVFKVELPVIGVLLSETPLGEMEGYSCSRPYLMLSNRGKQKNIPEKEINAILSEDSLLMDSLKSPITKKNADGTVFDDGLGLSSIGTGGTGMGTPATKKIIAGIKLSEPTIAGNANSEEVIKYVKRRQSQMKYCYERELNRNPRIQGKMTVMFNIREDGKVTNAQKKSSSLNSEAVESCVVGRFKRFRFPENQTATVEYPILFFIKN